MKINNIFKYAYSFTIIVILFASCPAPGEDASEIPGPLNMDLRSKDTDELILNGSTVNESVILYYSAPDNLNPEEGTFLLFY